MFIKQLKEKVLIRLVKGEKLVASLEQLAQTHNWGFAIISGIGAVEKITLGYYELRTKSYHWQDYSGDLEITSLSGNLSWLKDQPFIHLHANISDKTGQVVGGHVKEGIVGATLELVLDVYQEKIERMMDQDIGLNLLTL